MFENNTIITIVIILKGLSKKIIKYTSIPNIFKVIDNVINKKHFFKEKNENDKTKHNLHLTFLTIEEFEE
mgnify:FL=1